MEDKVGIRNRSASLFDCWFDPGGRNEQYRERDSCRLSMLQE